MNIRVITANHQIRILNYDCYDERDGSWFIYCRENIRIHKKNIVNEMKKFVSDFRIPGCDIEEHYYDVIRVYTSCDKLEVLRVRDLLINNFGFSLDNMVWVSLHETGEFNKEDGWLAHLNRFFKEYNLSVAKHQKKNKLSRYREHEQCDMEELKINIYHYFLKGALMNRKSMTIKPLFSNLSYEINPYLIFVLMPFSEGFSNLLFKSIREASGSVDSRFIVKRADDFIMPGIIIDDIWKGINEAGLLIADITVHNPNVFYELGIAHTLGKKVIILRSKDGESSPFDIVARRYLEYDILEPDNLKDGLAKILEQYLHEIE